MTCQVRIINTYSEDGEVSGGCQGDVRKGGISRQDKCQRSKSVNIFFFGIPLYMYIGNEI